MVTFISEKSRAITRRISLPRSRSLSRHVRNRRLSGLKTARALVSSEASCFSKKLLGLIVHVLYLLPDNVFSFQSSVYQTSTAYSAFFSRSDWLLKLRLTLVRSLSGQSKGWFGEHLYSLSASVI